MTHSREKPGDKTERTSSQKIKKGRAFQRTLEARTCVISRGKVSVRPLPNADFLSSDWFMRLWEGQPFSFEKF